MGASRTVIPALPESWRRYWLDHLLPLRLAAMQQTKERSILDPLPVVEPRSSAQGPFHRAGLMSAAHAADRLDAAVKLLLEGNSPHTVVADIAARYGCGKRQGRNVVAKAYQQIQQDVVDVGLDRKALVAQTVHCLQAGMAQALASNQIGSVIGTARELRELLGLGAVK